jgi:rhodanese-related sulfurtransferase
MIMQSYMHTNALSPVALRDLLVADRQTRVLDVRSAAEFEHGHIAGAYNVPLHHLGEHAAAMRDIAAHPVVLVCQAGERARRADGILRAAGLGSARVLDGGMNGWIQAGLPVRRVEARVSLERQVRMVAGSLAAAGALAALLLDPWFALLPLVIGTGLTVAGLTDTCGMALLLARLPYNRGRQTCDAETMVRRLLAHEE